MPRWLHHVLGRIHRLVEAGAVAFTGKALFELERLGLDPDDALEILAGLRAADYRRRLRSDRSGEMMYVFTPTAGTVQLYLKLVLRTSCVVVSFHEEEGREDA